VRRHRHEGLEWEVIKYSQTWGPRERASREGKSAGGYSKNPASSRGKEAKTLDAYEGGTERKGILISRQEGKSDSEEKSPQKKGRKEKGESPLGLETGQNADRLSGKEEAKERKPFAGLIPTGRTMISRRGRPGGQSKKHSPEEKKKKKHHSDIGTEEKVKNDQILL